MSVKVAVRVRPFNAREKDLGCKLVVKMNNPMTILLPNEKQQERKFTFDYSFWSFDGFESQENGYLKATPGSNYADQRYVYNQLGKSILDNAYKGYHCCLFAYGQTGSGKSYSMIGFQENKGIVPITCDELFKRIETKKQGEEFEVYGSMLQIYNETIQDLTIDISKRPSGGLKVRESKLFGIYVDGVKKHFVQSFQQIKQMMENGTRNRTIASTQMNATSSRAHTIITIQLRQKSNVGGTKTQKISMINLVDLAGSERQQKTGATGQRLKEAVGINLSLTTLGHVISILAENADGANKFVPYRNSSLTRILQNALGGNSQTIMICAISPASDNYEETLSTMRYADQAKKIKNKPIVNQSETDKLIRELKAENQRLRKIIENKHNDPNQTVKKNPEETQREGVKRSQAEEGKQKGQKRKGDNNEEDEEQLIANLNEMSKRMEEFFKTKEQKRKEAEEENKKEAQDAAKLHMNEQKIISEQEVTKLEKDKKLPPYLQNISRDMMLNRKLKILLQKKHIKVGKKNQNPPNDIIFGGRDMMPKHALIDIDEENHVLLVPLHTGAHLYVNGEPVSEKMYLKHNDRIIFGWNSVYLFKDKKHPREGAKKVKSNKVDWDYCKKEVQHHVDIDMSDSEEGGKGKGQGGCCRLF